MKAQDLPFTQLIEGSKQFIIPIFQRTYSWERAQCEQLWKDILRVGSSPNADTHFIGSAVYIPEENTSASISRWLVIDGQQRITTITLLLLALKKCLEAQGSEDLVGPAQVEDSYLKNRYGKGDSSYKILLTKTDKDTLIALLDNKTPSEPKSLRIVENFQFFMDRLKSVDLKIVYQGIQRLRIVDVRLQQGFDNPQMIFESMNSTGKALTQADLIRNFVLMGLEHDLQTRLYTDYWRPMEVQFGADSYVTDFDEFVRYYLVIQTGNHRIRRDEVYDEFKAYARNLKVEEMLVLIKRFAGFYCSIALGKEEHPGLATAFQDVRELRADVCYPLLMEVYEDYGHNRLSIGEFISVVRTVESYVFRRAVCDIPTNSLRQTFATFARRLKKDRYLESVQATFLLFRSYRRFPLDAEFMLKMESRNLYGFNRRSYWLRRFENFDRKERVQVQDYTIEHIMPQNEALRPEWLADLGTDWQRIRTQYLHTLGNLTLTGYNSEYSDRPFKEKRDMKGGFRESPLKLNQGIGICEVWNEAAIRERADRLAVIAAKIWPAPVIRDDILSLYRPQGTVVTSYTIDDHPYLNSGPARELFEAFRKEVLSLDECVHEEFLKLYVAYKAETNFVDVIPQQKRLILSLNIPFTSIEDPRKLCRDVTNLGRWGNGDVEMFLERLEDVPYAVGLARQALEEQLGDENVSGAG